MTPLQQITAPARAGFEDYVVFDKDGV